MIATMHRLPAATLVLLCCLFLFLATLNAQQQPQPVAGDTAASPPSCIPHERDALLAFKHGVTGDPAGLLDSWRRDGGHDEQNCCRWKGVHCSNRTGHVHELRLGGTYYQEGLWAMVGQISPSLLALQHLEHLDLSNNWLEGPTGRIPPFLGSLKSLTYLNLSSIPFHGSVPPQLGNLSKLHHLDLSYMGLSKLDYLDLSYMRETGETYSTDLSWLTRLPSIQYLNLNGVNLSTLVDWPHVMNTIPSLRALRLSHCSLVNANQLLPHLNLTNLEDLDASNNIFDHPMVTSWFWNLTSLKYLNLRTTSLFGQFPDALGDMTSLQVLDLSSSDYYDNNDKNMRVMSTDMKNLCNLEMLYISSSYLHGDVIELFRKLPRCSPNKLQALDLSGNQLSGMLPTWIGQFAGLRTLDLSCNNLSGNVPYEIGKLNNLIYLDLNSNNLNGVITEEHFVSARSLQYIDLSYNALKIEVGTDWQPPFRLCDAFFASCQMGPLFPGWLQWQVSIINLVIPSAGISGRLPHWFSDVFSNVEFMDITNNLLNGSLPTIMDFMSLQELYLSSNRFTGQIPTLPPNINTLDLSNNFLSGPLPSAIGSVDLIQLSLFSNQITGHIPQSFCKFQGLCVLDLSNNFLEGELPPCLGVMEEMGVLALSNNSFSGEFPSFLQNITMLRFLDLSRNKFSGRLPIWIGTLTSLIVLRLSHNNFYGNISMDIRNLACLRYMDINNNEISGPISSYLYRAGGCPMSNSGFFDLTTSVYTVFKGQELNLGSIDRALSTGMMSIDLSSNNLTGEIPEEIVVLHALVNLNVSRNHLTGVIPKKIGEMRLLESLDLSRNMLSGEIPTTLSNLTFLSDLDLSYNNLTGRIPSGTQLDTLYAEYPSMYIGNTGLCGHPLPNSCSNEGEAPKEGGLGRTDKGRGIQFFYLGLGCGFLVGTWMAFGVLLFKGSWRIACF